MGVDYPMTAAEIEQVLSGQQYERDVRRPPDERRRSRFLVGWEDATVREKEYAEETLKRLTWNNLGYRLGRFFGHQSAEQIDQAYDILAGLYSESDAPGDWRLGVRRWLNARQDVTPSLVESVLSFFELAFENTRCPEHAWFGVHHSTVSLVVGGIFLAALVPSGSDRGFWLLVDQQPPPIDGVEYKPVRSTRDSRSPLVWAHSPRLSVIPNVVANELIWESFGSATEKILHSTRIAGNRDSVQERRKKKRLQEVWGGAASNLFPDEVDEGAVFREGAKCQVTVNAYERDPRARLLCIRHYGVRCFICGFSFRDVYGEVAAGFIHVHHLRPLSEVGSEYTVDPVEDLRPVCPNCHAVLHLRKPAFSLQEVMEFLGET